MNNKIISKLLMKLKENTKRDFEYDENSDCFSTDVEGLDNKMISRIQSAFMSETYEMYNWKVKDGRLIFPYNLCGCHGCMAERREMKKAGKWIGD